MYIQNQPRIANSFKYQKTDFHRINELADPYFFTNQYKTNCQKFHTIYFRNNKTVI